MAKGFRLMLVVTSTTHIEIVLAYLRDAGRHRRECVVLWLGARAKDRVQVEETLRPSQTAEIDMFHIPPTSMQELQQTLRRKRHMVAAQIHSHPDDAFHSRADDRWAIVRHEGALSIVVPRFAADTTAEAFLNTAKVFRFSADQRWLEVPPDKISSCLQIV